MAFGWIDEEADRRRRAGLVRTLRPRPAHSPLLDLAGNDYLGLTRHREVTEGAAAAARAWGGGAASSKARCSRTASAFPANEAASRRVSGGSKRC
ncbi:hypothetical protein ACWD0J_24110, partial [Streptomyces sp. NPDC003011]